MSAVSISSFTHPDGRVWALAYDGDGNLASITDPDGGIRAFTYDSAHRMLTATDKAGVTYLVNEYDAAGRVVKQWDAEHNLRTFDYNLTAGLGGSTTYTDNEGNQSVFVFDGKSRITQITDALGNSEHYTFDAANNVTSYTNALGHTWGYQYDANNQLITETDPSGAQTHFTYTPTGEVATVTDEGGPGGSPRSTVMTVDSRGLTTKVMRPDGLSQQNTFDAHGDLVSTTDPAGGTVTFGYDARGNLVSTTDQLGRTSTFGYDSANRLVSATDPAGGTTTLVWDSNNRVVSQTNPAGGVTSFTYNANNKPLTRTDPDGAVTTFVWDDLFRMVSVTDPNGGTTTYSYNTEDAMVSVTDAAGSVTSRTLDALNRPVAVTDANGNQWASAYDAVGNVVASTDPLGAVTTFGYDAVGRPITVTDALGNSSTTTYDAVGRVVSASDALGGTISYVYDVLDRPVLVTDRGGFQRAVQYGPLGNVVTQVDERGKVTTFTYDAAGQLTVWAGPEGTGGSFAYDSRGNRVSATDAVGRTTTTAFDALKRPTSRTDPLGNTATVAYDAVGRVVSATDANGGVSSLDYDPAGNLLHSIDQLGQATSYLYDALGRQRGVTDPSGSTTRYSYDGLGRLASVTEGYSAAPLPGRTDTNLTTSYDYTATGLLSKITNPVGAVTRFGYNQVGVKTSETNPLGITWAFTVDALGRTTGMVDGNGKTTTYQYTARSQVSRVVYPGGVTVGYQYDAAGNLIAMTDALGSSGWIFDDAGRQAVQFDALGKQVRTGHDATGARTSVTMPGGAQIKFSFDAAGRPTGEVSPWGSVANVFDEVGNLLSVTRSTGVVSSYGYDAANRVTSIVHQTPVGGPMGGVPARLVPEPDPATLSNIPASCPASATDAVASYLQDRAPPGTGIKDCHQTQNYLATRTAPVAAEGLAPGSAISLAYTYNTSGDVVSASRTDGRGPKSTTTYRYDTVHRLAASTSPEGSNSYGYDRAGNRISWVSDAAPDTGDALSVTAVFNLAGQLLSESKTRGTGDTQAFYDYDGNGNRTRMRVGDATTDYRFDTANHLIGVSRSGMVTTSEVDGLGRQLVTATTTRLGTASTTQVWDGLHIIQQHTPEGTRTLLPDVFGDTTMQADSGGGQSWLLADRQGSIIAHTGGHTTNQASSQAGGQSGARVTQLASYSDWGVQSFATTGWDAVVGFTGELTDPTTGLNRYFARGYTPTSGVWVSPDPHRGILTTPATQHRYGYVAGNPVTLVDSLGFGWMGYGSANRAPASSYQMTADQWVRQLNSHPRSRVHTPSTHTAAIPERHRTACQSSADSACELVRGGDTTPFELGVQWLTATGPRDTLFVEGDYITELVRSHPFYTDARETLVEQLRENGRIDRDGFSYSLSGVEGVGKYIADYSTLLTGGTTGNIAFTYLGSHYANVEEVGTNPDGSVEVQFTIENTSSLESALRIPVIGYQDWYQNTIGAAENNFAEFIGLATPTSQTIQWTETIGP